MIIASIKCQLDGVCHDLPGAGKVPPIKNSGQNPLLFSPPPSAPKLELANKGIRVNCICPGQIKTDLGQWGWNLKAFAKGMNKEQFDQELKKEIPLNRVGTPEDCANVVAWLASDQSGYLTGQAINVTGGQLMEL